MEFAQLGDEKSDTHQAATVAFVGTISDGMVYVRRDLIHEHVFRSRHFGVFERTIRAKARLQLSRENEFLGDQERRHLDEKGVIETGVEVRAGDVLWSCRAAADWPSKKKAPKWEDDSERVHEIWDGAVVVAADSNETAKDRVEVRVTLELRQELGVGDQLYVADQPLGVVAGILESDEAQAYHSEAEILASVDAAKRIKAGVQMQTLQVAKHDSVPHFHVLARKGGPYSLISQQPLSRGQYALAQKVSSRHAKWLLERSLTSLLDEFAGLKCDELDSRAALEAYANGTISRSELPPASAPASRWLMQAEMMAMGLYVEFANEDGLAMLLRPAGKDEMLAVSSGLVKKPETINYRTYEGEPGGLFCPEIFNDKLTRFGHLELETPIVPIWWRHGSRSLLERLLPLSSDQIEGLVAYTSNVRIEDGQAVIGDDEAAENEPGDWLNGGEAILALLTEFAKDDLPPGLPNGPGVLAPDVLLVLPSPLRPLVLLDSGNFATSDLNDLYRRVINRNNRLSKLSELNAPAVIIRNERRMLQLSVDALFANELTGKPVLGSSNRPLKSLYDICLHRCTTSGEKGAVWSAKSRGIVDETLARHLVCVPQNIYDHLRLGSETPVLLTMEDGESFVALSPESTEEPIFRIPAQAAEALQFPMDGDAFLSLHAPLRQEAVAEALRLQRGEIDVRGERRTNWLEACPGDGLADVLSRLVNAAIESEPAALCTPKSALFAGLSLGRLDES